MGQTGRRSIATHILAVKIALAAAHFHGFGVAHAGPWVTWVNRESVRQYRSPPSTSWFKVYTRVCLHSARMPTEEVNDAQEGKEEQKLSAEVLDKFAELITFALGLVAALAWNEAIQQLFTQLLDRGGRSVGCQLRLRCHSDAHSHLRHHCGEPGRRAGEAA